MRVFISWSGRESHAVAEALRNWLPQVLQCVEPFISSADIPKGAEWYGQIRDALETSSFGLLCMTPENLESPFLHFEAGRFAVNNGQACVGVLRHRVPTSDIREPLKQFQNTDLGELEDVVSLLETIRRAAENSGDSTPTSDTLAKAVRHWWPDFEGDLQNRLRGLTLAPSAPVRTDRDLIEEILEMLRSEARLASLHQNVEIERTRDAAHSGPTPSGSAVPEVGERIWHNRYGYGTIDTVSLSDNGGEWGTIKVTFDEPTQLAKDSKPLTVRRLTYPHKSYVLNPF